MFSEPRTMIGAALLAAGLLYACNARAQVCTSQCVTLGNGTQQCTTICPTQPPITHRYDGPSRAEMDYQQRAYEFELRRLDQENRR